MSSTNNMARLYEQQQARTKQIICDKLHDLALKGDWQSFIKTARSFPELYRYSFSFFPGLPPEYKREFAVAAYSHQGDSLPCVRKAIRSLNKCEPPILPGEIAGREVITVYRAGEEDITKCKYRISWTTNKEVALFFLNEWRGKHAAYLYEASIRTKDILAYTNDRSEEEILQYRKVFDIKLLNHKGHS